MTTDHKTSKYQPGDTVSTLISGTIAACVTIADREGQVHKRVRINYGSKINPQFLVADESDVQPAQVAPRVSSVVVTKPDGTKKFLPFVPQEFAGGPRPTFAPEDDLPAFSCAHCPWAGSFEQLDISGGCPSCGKYISSAEPSVVEEAAPETASCQNCEWSGTLDELNLIVRYHDRVLPGDIAPAGECPECGALAHLDEVESGD